VRPRAGDGTVSVYSGKGATDVLAKVSTLMEAIERYSAEVKPQDENVEVKESYGGALIAVLGRGLCNAHTAKRDVLQSIGYPEVGQGLRPGSEGRG